MTPIALFLLDDSPDYHHLMRIILEQKNIREYKQFLSFRDMEREADKDVLVYVIDHYLGQNSLGIDVCRWIRNRFGYAPYIIILSNSDEGKVIREYIGERIFSYRLKTDDAIEIGNDISLALRLATEQAELRSFKENVRRSL